MPTASAMGITSAGKSAILIARKFGGRQRNLTDENFWARGYFVSTVGLDEDARRNEPPTDGEPLSLVEGFTTIELADEEQPSAGTEPAASRVAAKLSP